MGLLVSILAVNGFAQDCTLGSSPANVPCRQAAFLSPAHKPAVERSLPNQAFQAGSGRPGVLLASRGMRHEGSGHDYGERVAPTFSRIVQDARFIPILVLVGLLGIIVLAYRLWWYKPLLPVIVVARREIHGVVKSLGTVQSQEPVSVRSQRSGTIERLHVAQGDKVTGGQVLATLRPSTSKKAAPEDLVQMVAATDGVIANSVLAVGDEVYPATPIFQIVDAQPIRIAARSRETRGAEVRAGQAAVIKMGWGREFGGEVLQLKKDLDPVIPHYELLVKFHDIPDPAVIGEEASIIIATGQQTAPAVPITAITSRNDQQGVLVAAEGLVSFRPISLGVQDGKWAAALDGIQEGELVIVTPEATKPGKEVRAEVVAAAFVEA